VSPLPPSTLPPLFSSPCAGQGARGARDCRRGEEDYFDIARTRGTNHRGSLISQSKSLFLLPAPPSSRKPGHGQCFFLDMASSQVQTPKPLIFSFLSLSVDSLVAGSRAIHPSRDDPRHSGATTSVSPAWLLSQRALCIFQAYHPCHRCKIPAAAPHLSVPTVVKVAKPSSRMDAC